MRAEKGVQVGIVLQPFRDAESRFAVGSGGVAAVQFFGVERVLVPHEQQAQAVVPKGAGRAARVRPREPPRAVRLGVQFHPVRQAQSPGRELQFREVANQALVIERGKVCLHEQVVPVRHLPFRGFLPVGVDADFLQGLVEDGNGCHPLLLCYLPRRCGRFWLTWLAPEALLSSPFVDDVIAYFSGEVQKIIFFKFHMNEICVP